MMSKRILMVAYHFPPLAGSSGIQRTLRFAQHLPSFGWQPLVLSASPRAYERTSPDLDADIPAGTVVRRAFALDTARHLSLGGRYIGATARPDRWVSWRFDAVRLGMKLIREFRPQLIWSTYPIATAHLIGAELQRRSGLPWVADFRDPMAQDGYPEDPQTWQQYRQIEERAMHKASICIFTTPSAADEYRRRYAGAPTRLELLENGYDEETFANATQPEAQPLTAGAITLLHSGVVYPSERDPAQLIAALGLLLRKSVIRPGTLKLRFRAAVAEDLLRRLAAEHRVEDFVEICPPVPYREALAEMLRADGLLIMQASNCNAQIPAKLYEYLRARRPVLCLSDPAGDTVAVLRQAGLDAIAALDDATAIAQLLERFLTAPTTLRMVAEPAIVAQASRLGRTAALAALLDGLVRPAADSSATAAR
jgi:glycosyltransferase involved in cell wall biosynthesis